LYSREENEQIYDSAVILKEFDHLPKKTVVKTMSPLANSIIGRRPKEIIAYGKSEIIVHYELEEVLAFMWNFGSRARTKFSDLEKMVVEEKSLHNLIGYVCKKGTDKGAINWQPREGLSSNLWKRVNQTTVVLVAFPTTHHTRPIRNDRVRVEMPYVVKLEQLNNGRCKFTYCQSLGLGALSPTFEFTTNGNSAAILSTTPTS